MRNLLKMLQNKQLTKFLHGHEKSPPPQIIIKQHYAPVWHRNETMFHRTMKNPSPGQWKSSSIWLVEMYILTSILILFYVKTAHL